MMCLAAKGLSLLTESSEPKARLFTIISHQKFDVSDLQALLQLASHRKPTRYRPRLPPALLPSSSPSSAPHKTLPPSFETLCPRSPSPTVSIGSTAFCMPASGAPQPRSKRGGPHGRPSRGAGPLARSRLRVPGTVPDASWLCQAAG